MCHPRNRFEALLDLRMIGRFRAEVFTMQCYSEQG